MDLKLLSTKELLQLQSFIIDELKRRAVVRTKNNPLGDYTEWLVADALDLVLQGNSNAGYDGVDANGTRSQIKSRRITASNKSRQLGAIRNYHGKDFDYLAAVIFDEAYEVIEARLIPHDVIAEYAAFREHVNAHILILRGPILLDPRVRCIKDALDR